MPLMPIKQRRSEGESRDRHLATPPAESDNEELQGPRIQWALVLLLPLTAVRFSHLIEFASLATLGMLALVGRPRRKFSWRDILPLLLLGAAGLLSMMRGAPHSELAILVGIVCILAAAARRATFEVGLRSISIGMALYLVANILGWAAGATSPAAKVRTGLYETEFSLFGSRILFPFTRSINEPSIIAAALMAYIIFSWRHWTARLRLASSLAFVAGAFVLGASGSRFPLIALTLASLGAAIIPKFARMAPFGALVTMGVPFFISTARSLIGASAAELSGIPLLARGQNEQQLSELSSRTTIWERAIHFWAAQTDPMHRFVGYGYDGHVQSGVVYTYYTSGGFVNQPSALTLHNALLQEMYDGGYLGLALFVCGLLVVILRGTHIASTRTALIITVLLATASVEVFLEPTFLAAPFMLLLAIASVLEVPQPRAPEARQET